MAYSRPMYRRRAPARKYQTKPRSRSIYTKKVKPVRYALPAIARQVASIKRKVDGVTSQVQYQVNAANPIGNVAGNNLYVLPLSQYSGWNRMFGTDADDESNHQALWKKSNFDFEITANGERNQIDYSFYLVSLTKLGMEELFTPATGGLAGPQGITPPSPNTHYTYGGSAGMGLLNLKYFNIHQAKRFVTGSPGSLATDTGDLVKRWYFKISHNNGKGHVLKNAKGDWKAIPSPQLAAQNYYVLIINNDSTADASVQFRMLGLHTLQIS